MVRRSNFRLLYRVIFFCFCFACFHPHAGGSGDDRREGKTELKKLKQKFKGKPLNGDVFLKQDEYVSSLREDTDGIEAGNETDYHQMARKGKFLKMKNIFAL